MPVALITGTSTGIGLATSLRLARSGFKVFATMRDPAKSGRLTETVAAEQLPVEVLQLDVTDGHSIRRAFEEAIAREGRIDVLVNNAGINAVSAIEEASMDAFRLVMETNFFGAVQCMQEVLPHMRKQRTGCIVNVSSNSGRIAFPGVGMYVASKWALEGVSEVVAQEARPYGIRVAIVEPGSVKTSMIENTFVASRERRTGEAASESPYHYVFQRFGRVGATIGKHLASADLIAETIAHAITTDEPRFRYPVGAGATHLFAARAAMTDEEWLDLSTLPIQEGADRLIEMFGLTPGR